MRLALPLALLLLSTPARAEVDYTPYHSCPAATKALVMRVVAGFGGETVLRTVKGVRKVTDIEEVNAKGAKLQSRFEGVAVFPNSLFAKITLPTGSLTTVSTPDVAYVFPMNPRVEHAALRLNPDEKLTLTKFFYEEPLLVLRNRIDPMYLFAPGGAAKVNGVDTQLLYVNANGVDALWYVDPTGRVIRTKVGNKTTDFSDWRSVSGLTVPFVSRSESDGRINVAKYREFQVNPLIDSAAVFAKPTLWMTRNALPTLGRRNRARSSAFGDYVASYMDDYGSGGYDSYSFQTFVYDIYSDYY